MKYTLEYLLLWSNNVGSGVTSFVMKRKEVNCREAEKMIFTGNESQQLNKDMAV